MDRGSLIREINRSSDRTTIERRRNRHERVSRVPDGDVDRKGQADSAHCRTDVVDDFVERLRDGVSLGVEAIVSHPFVLLFARLHSIVLQDVEVFIERESIGATDCWPKKSEA